MVIVLLRACQRSESRYLNRSVKPTEVVGMWMMTPTGIEGLQFAGYRNHLTASDHRLLIRSDGSCSYQSFVSGWEKSHRDEGFITSDCAWHLGEVGHQALMIRFRNQSDDPPSHNFHFDETKGNLLLWQYAGHPDAWKYVEFAKRTKITR
jgi:hypothetical protein